jgi:four helix bundle protein
VFKKFLVMRNGTIKSYKDFDVYKKAFAASLKLHHLSLAFPKIEQYALADQIRRSSKSICANIAEGYSRAKQSPADFKRFLIIAISSAEETKVWLDYCEALKYIDETLSQALQGEYTSIARMIYKLHSSVTVKNN